MSTAVVPDNRFSVGHGNDSDSTQTDAQTAGQRANPFSCNICHRSYTRLDHLSRHYRSHTREKPFTCEVCSKKFARADLLKRHSQGHTVTDENGRKRQKISQPTPARATQACKACAASKVRCEGDDPCKRCQQKKIPCQFSHRARTNVETHSVEHTGQHTPSQNIQHESPADIVSVRSVDSTSSHAPHMLPYHQNYDRRVVPSEPQSSAFALPNPMAMPAPITADGSVGFHEFPPSMNEPSAFDQFDTGLTNFLRDVMFKDSLTGTMTDDMQVGGPELQQQIYNSMDLLDFAVADPFNTSMGVNAHGSPLSHNEVAGSLRQDDNGADASRSGYTTPSRTGLSLGIKAFSESLWQYAPVQGNTVGEDQIDMFLPLEDLVDRTRCAIQDQPCPALKQPTRDRVLATVLSQCNSAVVSSVISSFPSAELLTNLIHQFLNRHRASEDTWIHLPSFDPNQQMPATLLSMIAAGAMYSEFPQVRKLGHAFQEAARVAGLKVFETDNRTTRFLKPLQSFTLTLDLGLWSGDRRKLELAEAFSFILVTIARRAGFFRRSQVTAWVPNANDSDDDTEIKWHQWIEQESFKRVVFHLLLRDVQTSSSLISSPLISTAELSIELPCSTNLWCATNSVEWRNTYLLHYAHLPGRMPSFRSMTEDLSVVQGFVHVVDVKLTTLLLLAGLWSMTFYYRELMRLDYNHARRNTALITSSLHQETVQALEHCRFTCSEWGGGMTPRSILVHERILLSMCVSLGDVQLLAGKSGEEEARRVYPMLSAWTQNRESRQALWHAGQIFRAAKTYPARKLQDYSAVTLYHASLVFWAHSIAQGSGTVTPAERSLSRSEPFTPPFPANSETSVHLDGEMTEHVNRYIVLGKGQPVITVSAQQAKFSPQPDPSVKILPITDVRGIMACIVDLLKRNNGERDEECPPLITNLSKLMQELGYAADGIRSAQAKSSSQEN